MDVLEVVQALGLARVSARRDHGLAGPLKQLSHELKSKAWCPNTAMKYIDEVKLIHPSAYPENKTTSQSPKKATIMVSLTVGRIASFQEQAVCCYQCVTKASHLG
jgi:hypothetical protein